MSVESQGPSIWNYATGGQTPAAYAESHNSATHGRRSRLFQEQNSTLFNAFEEEGMALTQLPEEDEDEDDDDDRRGETRTLVGRRERDVDGGRHPAYHEV